MLQAKRAKCHRTQHWHEEKQQAPTTLLLKAKTFAFAEHMWRFIATRTRLVARNFHATQNPKSSFVTYHFCRRQKHLRVNLLSLLTINDPHHHD